MIVLTARHQEMNVLVVEHTTKGRQFGRTSHFLERAGYPHCREEGSDATTQCFPGNQIGGELTDVQEAADLSITLAISRNRRRLFAWET